MQLEARTPSTSSGCTEEAESKLESLLDLPSCVLGKQLEHLVATDLNTAIKLSTTSKQLKEHFAETLAREPEMNKRVTEARDEHVKACLEEARSGMALADPSTAVTLWMSALSIAMSGVRGSEEWRALEVYQWLVHAYSLSLFSRAWPARTAKAVLLIFDFSLSLAGNIFCTLLASTVRTRLSSMLALLSVLHALVTSVLLLSVSVHPDSWRSLGGTLHKLHNRLAVILYFSLAFYHDSFPGAWRLASASCRLFTLVYMSWLAVIPKES